ncbi:hypothetical protein DL766_002767 [Monosporascus sp. MC13-8B]|uniref:6-phosphogluconate dehydrogenase, decarboxylating n=1 Tax=Monosporascus cannonballus TaxID=155416 RepID=A0ABY0HIQ1_9PEZI|nr:hypothetical protein DL762_000515 [Monosporascus cannonballus]RYO96026.1 hypothetical protein DL763_003418 [Monosporascus cannonballus]RYP34869.1 hypothetical protein DL766_002767 [Monosporascus sp. MC13-8B]
MAGKDIDVKKVGMLGVGSMGSMLSLLLAELGVEVFYYDPSDKNMDMLERQSKDIKLNDNVHRTSGYDEVCKNLETPEQPKVFMFSAPHGEPADECVEALKPHLKKGDVIIDCGNEHWANTERRQRDLDPQGIHYVGCGVSGGYQSARHGPSMSPGGSPEALERVMPLLEKMAARDRQGRPCVVPVGPGGSGHYVKMVHNGIEQGMMSVIAEAWMLLTGGLGLSHEQVSDVFESWNKSGPLHDCFLVDIGVGIERARGGRGEREVEDVRDKVTQDVTEEEGTGIWTCEQAVMLHVPASSLLSAHLFRCASSDAARRMKNRESADGTGAVKTGPLSVVGEGESKKHAFVERLHAATYFCFLACFAQGLDIIRSKDRREGWGLDYVSLLRLWRGGCIIQADHIADLLEGVYRRPDHDPDDVLSNAEVGRELAAHYGSVKEVALRAVEADLFVPALGQTLEWYKYDTSTHLPTQFMEAQLDYFGQHMFDTKDDPLRGPKKGKHHYEWQPATGISRK